MAFTKEELEKLEAERLAPYAVKSIESAGRKYKESEKASGRLCFQKDRDRIIHCKAFRRLDEKTQVFPAFFGDHYRTRLTHTIEVAQISRDICRRMGLNEDLAEAIALAHDLGHPPFGHSGEEALDEMMAEAGARAGVDSGFEHNEQSRRVVAKLEKIYPDFDGLNLSMEVLDGLEKHKTSWDQAGKQMGKMHLEGQVVNLADEIAYTNHDMDDGMRSGILGLEDLVGARLWKESEAGVLEQYGEIDSVEIRNSRVISHIIYMMIGDICDNFDGGVGGQVAFSEAMSEKVKELREILYERFYLSDEVRSKLDSGKDMIKKLFKFYLENPGKVPEKYFSAETGRFVGIKDYIAGMTDRFLEKEFEKNVGSL